MLAGCGITAAVALQLLGPPPASPTQKQAEAQPTGGAVAATDLVLANIPPPDAMPKAPDTPAEAAPPAPIPDAALVARPSQRARESGIRPRQRPVADPVQVAINRLKKQQRLPRDQAHSAPSASITADPGSWEREPSGQDLTSNPKWLREPNRYPHFASEPAAPWLPEQPGLDWAPPPLAYHWYQSEGGGYYLR
jgi:hypothetical protein